MNILGKKTFLRPFEVRDITEEYISWLNNPEVTRFSNQRFKIHNRESSELYLNSFKGTDNLFFLILDLESKKAIGTLTCYISLNHQSVDIGILIGEIDTWGKGFGQDAWDAIMNWLLNKKGFRKITAGTLSVNKGMVKLMERSGMEFEARRKKQEILEGEFIDLVYYAKFNDEVKDPK